MNGRSSWISVAIARPGTRAAKLVAMDNCVFSVIFCTGTLILIQRNCWSCTSWLFNCLVPVHIFFIFSPFIIFHSLSQPFSCKTSTLRIAAQETIQKGHSVRQALEELRRLSDCHRCSHWIDMRIDCIGCIGFCLWSIHKRWHYRWYVNSWEYIAIHRRRALPKLQALHKKVHALGADETSMC